MCTRWKQEFEFASKRYKLRNLSAKQRETVFKKLNIDESQLNELVNDNKASQIGQVYDWLNTNLRRFTFGNTLKTLQDVGYLEKKTQKGEKRGKKRISLE